MCLLLIAFRKHPDYKLIVAANRDEFYNRPSSPAKWWDGFPNVLAGRDLKEGGTWLGITKKGNFAALTNFRDPRHEQEGAPSRGLLVADYLNRNISVENYLSKLAKTGKEYNGFNLIWGNIKNLWYYSNQNNQSKVLSPGIYGLSNHYLDTPWPKVKRGKQMLESIISSQVNFSSDAILELLSDSKSAPDSELPDTGIGPEWEKRLSPVFIKTPIYGTRSSTVLIIDQKNQVTFIEKSFVPEIESQYRFQIKTSG